MARGAAAPRLLLCGVWRAQAEAEVPPWEGGQVYPSQGAYLDSLLSETLLESPQSVHRSLQVNLW